MRSLLILLVVVNLLTVLGWVSFHKKATPIEYATSNTNSTYKYEIAIARPWWQVFFMDEYFTPQFTIRVKNIGADIPSASLGCYLAEHDDVSTFPSVKNLKDFQHFEINGFKNGETRQFDAVVRSKFLKPTNYMLRLEIVLRGSVGSYSPRELLKEIEGIPASQREQVMKLLEQHWRQAGIDPDKPGDVIKTLAAYDFRWLEVIKVHPTLQTLGTIATVLGLSIVGLIVFVASRLKAFFT
jgi:hypothetical protein